jgi:ATPase family associated with various cellular activities (AAA)
MKTIEQELKWFTEVLETRLKLYFGQETNYKSVYEIAPPIHSDTQSPYSQFVIERNLNAEDRLLLILALVPTLKPQLLDMLFVKNSNIDQRFTEFGCIHGQQHNGLIPTLETFLFIVAGDNLDERMRYLFIYHGAHPLFQQKLLSFENAHPQEPFQSSAIVISPELNLTLLKGGEFTPEYSPTFPAQKVITRQNWNDLVLENEVMIQLDEVRAWINHGHELFTELDLGNKIKPGYRSLFYGPSGTGKTLSATLLGKATGREVYRIDLSMIVSKYIGETEKNLSKIFDRAENKNWILFFDEADALFGKRTSVKDSHDRYANQETSYLLQRVEDYKGLVILATNLKANIDDAFARRFQSVIHFPMPSYEQRELLWKNTFSPKIELDSKIDIQDIASKYELAGGSILNVVSYCSLMALKRPERKIFLQDVLEGIKREFQKEGKTV